VEDLTQNPVPAGNVAFTLRPGIDTTISGNARFTPTTVNCAIKNATVSSFSGTGTITVNFTSSEPWQIGDAIIFRGTPDATMNASSVASPIIITGLVGGGGFSFTFTLAGLHSSVSGGGTGGGLYAQAGTGPCNVTQNSALNPAYTSYSVAIQPLGNTTSTFNTYAIGAGPIDISTIVPTPSQQPSYSFVDLFSNGQVISGQKSFTNTGNTYSGGTFNNPILNNATFNTSTATSWLIITPTIQAPIFTTQPITLAGTFNYSLSWANPAAARAISIVDPGGTDSFAWVNAVQTIKNKTFDNTNTFAAGAALPTTVYNTASGSSAASIGPTTMVTVGATNLTYRFSWYLETTVVGTTCTGATNVVTNVIFQDPLGAAPSTSQGLSLPIATTGAFNGVVGPAATELSNAQNVFTFRAKTGTVIQYSTTYSLGSTCSPGPQYVIFPILEQLTAN
jgi:hypothetical protein